MVSAVPHQVSTGMTAHPAVSHLVARAPALHDSRRDMYEVICGSRVTQTPAAQMYYCAPLRPKDVRLR